MFDPAAGTLTFNVTIVSDPQYIKFPDGVARLTYEKAVHSSAYARVCPSARLSIEAASELEHPTFTIWCTMHNALLTCVGAYGPPALSGPRLVCP